MDKLHLLLTHKYHVYLQKFGVDLSGLPNVTAWLERCKSLPGFEENEEGASIFGNGLKSKLEEPF